MAMKTSGMKFEKLFMASALSLHQGRAIIRGAVPHSPPRHEPNDEILEPAAIRTGREIEAGIVDSGDSDVYGVAVKPGPVRVTRTNRSTTLVPTVILYGDDKAEVTRQRCASAGQYTLKVEQ